MIIERILLNGFDLLPSTGETVNLEERLGFLVMEALTHLLSANSQNAAVFRESGGAKCAVALVAHLECRIQALSKYSFFFFFFSNVFFKNIYFMFCTYFVAFSQMLCVVFWNGGVDKR